MCAARFTHRSVSFCFFIRLGFIELSTDIRQGHCIRYRPCRGPVSRSSVALLPWIRCADRERELIVYIYMFLYSHAPSVTAHDRRVGQ